MESSLISQIFSKMYLIFLVERLLSSCFIVFVAMKTAFVGIFVILVQLATILTIVLIVKRIQASQNLANKSEG